jgi:hypothetical protein
MHPHPSAAAKAGGMAATATEATTASTSRERWRRNNERRTNRARNETPDKLAVHPCSSIVQSCCDHYRRNR